ncbi:MAG: peptidyl-prolyl cis-trans isomerase, partial [Campylobacter sp.]|nr:peptidyl-prolyl cis-trans isomerase [Campylobacter sp.]
NIQDNGAFNKKLYYDVLRRARINPNDYEKNLKTVILLDKLRYALNLPAIDKDIDAMTASFFMQDKIAFQIIKTDNSEINFNEDEIKALWEKNKNNYMTKTLYGLDTLYVESQNQDVNETALNAYYNENKEKYKNLDDKIKAFADVKDEVSKDYNVEQSKTNALEKYIAVKKGELSTDGSMSLDENNATFSIDEIADAKLGDVIKPFIYQNGYLIVKIKSITPPQPMSYEQAKEQILEIYKVEKLKELVENKAKIALKDFKSDNTILVSRDINNTMDGLDMDETRLFVDKLFESHNKKDYIVLEDKAVIYDILEQKLLTNNINNNYKQLTEQNAMLLKNNELIKDLTNELQKLYEVKEYVKR